MILTRLVRPTLFTVGVCGTCFCGCAIFQYERSKNRTITDLRAKWTRHRIEKTQKFFAIRDKVNTWANQLTKGQKIAGATIFINFLVLGAWRINGLTNVMSRYFLCRVSDKVPLSPMILSCFSHISPMHFGFNMYALYSFSDFATALLGPEQVIGLYLSAGAVSSLTSVAHRLLIKSPATSLGASGALFGVISYICTKSPDSGLLVFFIPVAAGVAIKSLMLLDTVGLIAKWKLFDHAAHLGGASFGMWYAMKGEELFHHHKASVINSWIKLKSANK